MAPVVIRFDVRPWTANSARSARHWSENARRTAEWRTAFTVLAQEAGVGPLGPCRVIVTPYLARGPRQDLGACFPASKAGIDGLVDAGVWPDDTPDWVTRLEFRPPVMGQGDGLELRLEPEGPALGGPGLRTR
jgi:hypothetical protein